MAETDPRLIPAFLSNKFTVMANDTSVRIVFGEEQPDGPVAYHSAILMMAEDGKALTDLIVRLMAEVASKQAKPN